MLFIEKNEKFLDYFWLVWIFKKNWCMENDVIIIGNYVMFNLILGFNYGR